VRLHDKLARIEISPEEMPSGRFLKIMAAKMAQMLKKAGFLNVGP